MRTTKQTTSWLSLFAGLNSLRLLALCGGVALYAVNVNVINVLLPSIVEEMGGVDLYTWATSLFIAASILSVALSARCIDLLGLRSAFLLAILIFILGSVGTALSSTMHYLVGARSIQGLGGGLLLGLSYASVRMVFKKLLWLRVTAIISSMWGVAALAGPAVGGLFAQSGHWRLAFVAILPIALAVAFLVMLSLKRHVYSDDQSVSYMPFFKAALLAGSVIILNMSTLSASFLLIGLAVVVLVAILYGIARDDENNPKAALFPAGSYSINEPLGSLFAGVALMSVVISPTVFVPYYLENIHDLSPFKAGYMTALVLGGWAFGSLSTVKFTPGAVNKLFIIGPLCSALSLVALALLLPWSALSTELNVVWVLSVPLFGVGLGLGVVWPHLINRIFIYAPAGQENTTSSAMIALQLYTISIGVAVAGLITSEVGLAISLAHTQLGGQLLFGVFAVFPLLFILLSRAARLALKAP